MGTFKLTHLKDQRFEIYVDSLVAINTKEELYSFLDAYKDLNYNKITTVISKKLTPYETDLLDYLFLKESSLISKIKFIAIEKPSTKLEEILQKVVIGAQLEKDQIIFYALPIEDYGVKCIYSNYLQ